MKNNILKTIALLVLITVFGSCSDDNPAVTSFTLEKYLAKAGFTDVESSVSDDSDYEFGISFIPSVDGEITKVIAAIPDDRTDLRITIWDVDSETVLETITIASVTADVVATVVITPLALEKNKEYMITFNSNDWYNWTKPDDGDTTYPIKVGHISVTGYAYIDGTAQAFPTEWPTDYYAGNLGFVFKAD